MVREEEIESSSTYEEEGVVYSIFSVNRCIKQGDPIVGKSGDHTGKITSIDKYIYKKV